ncbi:MAG: S-layer homology domain-containing protein, partial [Clostridia bacterium]|nr:S-layer homology domain-containing protein [Clostridia bacterium]
TILWRMEGSPAVDSLMRFADVPAGQWYTEAIRWASSNGIVNGYSDTAFGPDDAITREQLAAILWRYAKAGGHDVSHTADLSGYSDAAQISSWASEAMQWACKTGILDGGDKILAPQKIAERSLAAVWLMRFCGLYA